MSFFYCQLAGTPNQNTALMHQERERERERDTERQRERQREPTKGLSITKVTQTWSRTGEGGGTHRCNVRLAITTDDSQGIVNSQARFNNHNISKVLWQTLSNNRIAKEHKENLANKLYNMTC